ncbi:LysR family transcriptional regulator [Thalassovita aquimarina]|uniref:LysR family transcriptional regulator n=1 Tax=Thalassovita aquimarina TaxID=2785917 RepID=A0ABS5HLM0_9RHOB|nr:LysR family transcriptional regulator [Thalassovita aquimarina]MBR9649503.1 LysR family transcriptional regulator [Thalassovita aquimarina]
MNQINVAHLDLNLLKMLVALAQTGSVSQAGAQLGLSQPAASNALARLRDAIGDPLFIRTGNGMVPTPFAETVLPDITRHLDGIFGTLGHQTRFDPAHSKRIFRLSLSGLGEVVFLPKLVKRVFSEAPDVRLHNVPVPAVDLPEALERGRVELAIGMIDATDPRMRALPLFQDRYVAIAGRAFSGQPQSLEDLRTERLVVTAPAATYATDLGDVLSRTGLTENVALQLGNFGALPHLLEAQPLVAIVPSQYGEQLQASGQARLLPVDIAAQNASIKLIWHQRAESDPACTWLQQIAIDTLRRPE